MTELRLGCTVHESFIYPVVAPIFAQANDPSSLSQFGTIPADVPQVRKTTSEPNRATWSGCMQVHERQSAGIEMSNGTT